MNPTVYSKGDTVFITGVMRDHDGVKHPKWTKCKVINMFYGRDDEPMYVIEPHSRQGVILARPSEMRVCPK